MERWSILLVLLFTAPLHAQPGPPEPLPCSGGFPLFPFGRDRPDLLLQYHSVGTDDMPSSAGTCTQVLVTEPHMHILHVLNGHGQWSVWAPDRHGTLEPLELELGLAEGRLSWQPGHIGVAWQGYGDFFTGSHWTPLDPAGWRAFVVRTEQDGPPWLALMWFSTSPAEGLAGLYALKKVREGHGVDLRW
ncbi:MAG: hypothetical protein KDB88_01300 [Flavobacteriales bacterium]|nr:hypothetical protein [Flavobacteriales bacterium]